MFGILIIYWLSVLSELEKIISEAHDSSDYTTRLVSIPIKNIAYEMHTERFYIYAEN